MTDVRGCPTGCRSSSFRGFMLMLLISCLSIFISDVTKTSDAGLASESVRHKRAAFASIREPSAEVWNQKVTYSNLQYSYSICFTT